MLGELKKFAVAFCTGLLALIVACYLMLLWARGLGQTPGYQGVVTIDIAVSSAAHLLC